jgi:PUA domain protein
MSAQLPRRTLREKEGRELLSKFARQMKLNEQELPRKGRFDQLSVDDLTILMIDGEPFLIENKDRLLPALQNHQVLERLPHVVVDMGAVPHVVNGADVMAPGIRKIEGEFSATDCIVVVDEKFRKPIAVGAALISSDEMRATKKGKVIRNLHYVGDAAWNSGK